MATILTKKSDTASAVPLAADLTNAAGGAELAVNATDKRLFSKASGGTVVELGTNPSTLSLPNGTANTVPYLNGSKVVTSGTALSFDGTNLGLGVTPSAWGSARRAVEVGGTTVAQFASASTYGAFSTNLYVDSSNWRYKNNGYGMVYSQDSNGSHIWYNVASGTAGNIASLSQAMTLDASGNLLLGTTSQFQSGKFCSEGSLANYNLIALKNTTTYSAGQYYQIFLNSSGTVIGGVSQASQTTLNYATSSDERLKDNIVDAPSSIESVCNVRIRSFDWKDGGEHQEFGVIAQEVLSVVPEAVSVGRTEDDMMGVDYSKFVPRLIKAIQEQQAIIESLKARLDAANL